MNENHTDGMDLSLEGAEQESERLVRAIAEGDREAERAFAIRYLPAVRTMLLARTRDPDLAADLRQEVMIQAISALRRGQMREPARLTAFVIGIARNVLNSHYRTMVRHPAPVELPEDLPDLSISTERAEDQEREALALEAISNLEHTDRAILQLVLLEGLKPGVIAKRLHLNPDVVRQRKLRAIRRITDSLRLQSQSKSPSDSMSGKIK